MPDERMIHRRMLRGDRIGALTDFERGVWLAYELISDDYGVMRFSAVNLQEAIWLESKPRKTVQRAFQRCVDVKLVALFDDQRRTYVYQPDWQSWQSVRYPRATIEPCPPIDALLRCDLKTQALFLKHSRCPAEFLLKESGRILEALRSLARAGGRDNANATASVKEGGAGETGRGIAHEGPRLKIFRWQHEDLGRRLGAKDFDLLGWYSRLETELASTGESFADQWKWLQARLYRDADLPLPNLMGLDKRPAASTAREPTHAMEWWEECKQLHGGSCGGRYAHGLKMRGAQAV